MKPETTTIENIAIVGAGTMGTGIAEVASLAGYHTTLIHATSGHSVDKTRDRIVASMNKRVANGKLAAERRDAALALLTISDDRDSVNGCDLAIESVIEDRETKRKLFEELARRTRPETILATNTSTLRISDLIPVDRAHRTLGMHFFSPVPAMSLVEVAHVADTDSDAVIKATRFVESLDKTAIPVVDSTGFVVNRLLVPYLIGSIAAYEQGLAGAAEIDKAMQLGCGHPMGPLALADFIGLDIVFNMSRLLYKDFGDNMYRPPALLRRLVQNGHLGKKSGLGFYDYSQKPAVENRAARYLQGDDADVA